MQANSLSNRPLNDRAEYNQNQVQRGNIVTADGVTVATSKPSKRPVQVPAGVPGRRRCTRRSPATTRSSPQSQAPNYATGVERAENALLTGTGSQLAFRNFIDMITNKPQKGATVQLTVNSKAQQVAYQQLQTGARRARPSTASSRSAAWSRSTRPPARSWPWPPTRATTRTSSRCTTPRKLNQVDTKLTGEDPSPLLNNASQTTLPPGSTFKIVTSSAWYNQDSTRNPNTVIDSPQPLTAAEREPLNNDSNEQCGNGSGKTAVYYAFAQSCNTPFAKLGIQLGGSTIKSMATQYGLNNPSALDITGVSVAASNFTAEADKSFTAFDAIGQHDTTVTPLQEAMFAATVANGGTLMKPYLVQQVTASDLSVVQQTQPQQLSQPISGTIAGYEKQMMTAVVQQPEGTGYAFNANNENGLVIAGKTGTAQNGAEHQPRCRFHRFCPS